MKTYGEEFNWAHLDYYGENGIGQIGFGFSLILIHKYGNEKRTDKFYNEKYFDAFPMLLGTIAVPTYFTKEEYAGNCYSLRTFDRFLSIFGCVQIEQERGMDAEKFILKGDVFDKIFEILPHRNQIQ